MNGKSLIRGIILCSLPLLLEAYSKPDYTGLGWQDSSKRVIKGPKSYAAQVRTIPKRNDLLKASFDGKTITMDTREFYALPDLKKEVILYLPGIRANDGVRLKPGEIKGNVWNCYTIRIKGPAGGRIALVFEGRRDKKHNNGHFRTDRFFILDGTEQTLTHKLELPADVVSFGLRLDLRSPGVFRFEAPDFHIETKNEEKKYDPNVNYLLNGGAENGYDNTIYIPLKHRAHAAHDGAYLNWKGERETFKIEFERDSRIIRSGKYAFRMRFSGSGPMSSRVDTFAFNPVPLLPGEMYTYTVWAKAERPAMIEMGLYLGHGAGIGAHRFVGTDWTKLELHVPSWGVPGKDFQNKSTILNSYQEPAGLFVPTFVVPPNNTVWFDDACVTIGSRKEIADTKSIFFRSSKLDKPNQYYFPGEAVKVRLRMESIGEKPVSGKLFLELFDFFGKSVVKQELKSLTLHPNRETEEQFEFTPPANLRGPMNLVCTFDTEKAGKYRRTFYLGVVDRPNGLNRRFSLEAVASQNVQKIIPFFLNFGIGAVRIGSASGNITRALENAPFFHKAGIEVLMNYSLHKKAEKDDETALGEFLKRFRADLLKYRDFLTVIESHNEANLSLSVAWNARVIREMRNILNEAAPHLKFAGPDPCGTDFAWIQGVLASGAANDLDIVSEHPYRKLPEQPDYGEDVAAVRRIIDLYKPGAPHYATEAGRVFPPVLPDGMLNDYVRIAAARDLRNMLLGFGNGLARYNQFAISSWEIGIAWNALFMGCRENNGAQLPGPILFAMRNASDRLGDGKAAGRIRLGYNYRAFLFDKGNSRTAVLWKFNGGDAELLLKSADAHNVKLYDMVGSRLNPTKPFPVGEFPVYLESTLSVLELDALIRRTAIRENAGKPIQTEALVVSPFDFRVKVCNLGMMPIDGIRVRVDDAHRIEGPAEQRLAALEPEGSCFAAFRLKKAVSTDPRKIALTVSLPDGKEEKIELNLTVLTVPKAAKKLKIDGDLSDWPAGNPVILDNRKAVVLQKALWEEKERKIRAELRYAWNDNNLYLAITVFKDSLNVNPDASNPGNVWQYDSFQLCLDPLHNGKATDLAFSDDDFEYSLGVVAGKPTVFRRTGSSAVYDSLLKAPGIAPEVRFAVRSEPGKTIYEAAFPRQAVSPFQLRAGSLMRSSIIVNLHEQGKRIGYLELTPGIGDTKSPGKWMDTVLLP